MNANGSWLLPDGRDRERLIDMNRRLAPVRRATLAIVAAGAIAAGPWIGWWTLLPLLMAAVLFRLTDSRLGERRRPEYSIFATWVTVQLVIGAAVALSGGPASPALPWLAIPIPALVTRFPARGIAVGIGATLVLLVAVSFGNDFGATIENPTLVIATATLILAVAVLTTALMHSEVEHRDAAIVDSLTGLLNRKALHTRAAELAEQTAVTGAPVGVIVADLDDFKQINDTHGHAAGDAVLKDVAYTLRKQMRAFDLVYRLGGEEVVVLLPGSTRDETAEIAEELRAAVARTSVGGLDISVTISCGVAASTPGDAFDYPRVFAAADQALYEAKRSGRDRVCSTAPVPIPAIAR